MFDGLESLFTASLYNSAHSILRALNNRTHIFAIALKLDYSVVKENEQRAEEERGKLQHSSNIRFYVFFSNSPQNLTFTFF